MSKKIPGFNFLHDHPSTQWAHEIDDNHVIVDREDWELAVKILKKERNLKILNP